MNVILRADIGAQSTIPGWPSNDIDGLFDALNRWPLDVRMDMSDRPEFVSTPGNAPFRGLAWGYCKLVYREDLRKHVFVSTKPIYPEHPDAVSFSGNFASHSFVFRLDTDDQSLIAKLDKAIAENMERFHGRQRMTA